MNPAPGDIYLVDLGFGGKKRPAVVVSRQDPNSPRAICIVAPITSEYRGSSDEVSIGKPKLFREPESWVNVQALASVGHHMLEKSVGRLTSEQLNAVKQAERFALDL
jgi:mRNA interferase MazF